MMLPKFVTVAGKKIRVIEKPLKDDRGLTEFDGPQIEIYIDSSLKPEVKRSTLFHEMVHVALHIGGIAYLMNEDLEEATTRCLEYILYPSLGDIK